MTRPSEPGPQAPAPEPLLEALRGSLRRAHPLVVEHDWGRYYAYGAPAIFAFLWPQAGHVTLGFLAGRALQPVSRRLLGQGPALRTVVVRRLEDVDAELQSLLARAAELAADDERMA